MFQNFSQYPSIFFTLPHNKRKSRKMCIFTTMFSAFCSTFKGNLQTLGNGSQFDTSIVDAIWQKAGAEICKIWHVCIHICIWWGWGEASALAGLGIRWVRHPHRRRPRRSPYPHCDTAEHSSQKQRVSALASLRSRYPRHAYSSILT